MHIFHRQLYYVYFYYCVCVTSFKFSDLIWADLNITSEQKYVLSLHSYGKSFLNKREIFELCRDTENGGLACTHIFGSQKATNGSYEFVVEFISIWI